MDILAQYSDRFGASPLWSQAVNGLTIARFQPTRGVELSESEVFVTAGMSDRAMIVPEASIPARIELLVVAPKGWQDLYTTAEPNFFVVEMLSLLAGYPFEAQTFLGDGHTMPTGRPLAPNTSMCGLVMSHDFIMSDARPLEAKAGPAALLLCTTLHEHELALAQFAGTGTLMTQLVGLADALKQDWGFWARPERPDVVKDGLIAV